MRLTAAVDGSRGGGLAVNSVSALVLLSIEHYLVGSTQSSNSPWDLTAP